MYYDLKKYFGKGEVMGQYPISSYWADFALPKYMIVIECDGNAYHKNRKDFDRRRDAHMHKKGWKVLRFSYHQVKNKRSETMKQILNQVEKRKHLADRIEVKSEPAPTKQEKSSTDKDQQTQSPQPTTPIKNTAIPVSNPSHDHDSEVQTVPEFIRKFREKKVRVENKENQK